MLIDRYFDQLFHRPVPRIPSRLVRYGIIYGDSAKNALNEIISRYEAKPLQEFEPKFDPLMKKQAELMVEKLQAFIALMEEYEENTTDGPTEEDDSKAEAKAKAKPKRKTKKAV
jgi:hypothetical protein